MNTFKNNTKQSFKRVKEDIEDFKAKTEKYILQLIERMNNLEAEVEELRAGKLHSR
jgi:cytochrome c556